MPSPIPVVVEDKRFPSTNQARKFFREILKPYPPGQKLSGGDHNEFACLAVASACVPRSDKEAVALGVKSGPYGRKCLDVRLPGEPARKFSVGRALEKCAVPAELREGAECLGFDWYLWKEMPQWLHNMSVPLVNRDRKFTHRFVAEVWQNYEMGGLQFKATWMEANEVYWSLKQAKADFFNHIEMFYNLKRRHGIGGDTSPVPFERRHSQRLKSV